MVSGSPTTPTRPTTRSSASNSTTAASNLRSSPETGAGGGRNDEEGRDCGSLLWLAWPLSPRLRSSARATCRFPRRARSLPTTSPAWARLLSPFRSRPRSRRRRTGTASAATDRAVDQSLRPAGSAWPAACRFRQLQRRRLPRRASCRGGRRHGPSKRLWSAEQSHILEGTILAFNGRLVASRSSSPHLRHHAVANSFTCPSK